MSTWWRARHATTTGGAWQGFKAHITRWVGAELTIIVLANLREAAPERLVEGIAERIDPALVPVAADEHAVDPAASAGS